jgi:hypothetical protein
MAITKEWHCECGRDFEAAAPVCPRCGREAKRAFRTPVGINGGRTNYGSAKRIDGILEAEFKRQGISNFSNAGGINRVEYARLVESHPGVYSSSLSGAPAQPAISAQFVKGGLSNPQLAREMAFQVDGTPWRAPVDDAGVMVRPGTKVGRGSPELLERTFSAGRTDNKGNQI